MSTSSNNQTQPNATYLKIKELLTPYTSSLDIYQFNIDSGILAVVSLKAESGDMQDLPPGVGVLILFGDIQADIPPGLTLLD